MLNRSGKESRLRVTVEGQEVISQQLASSYDNDVDNNKYYSNPSKEIDNAVRCYIPFGYLNSRVANSSYRK